MKPDHQPPKYGKQDNRLCHCPPEGDAFSQRDGQERQGIHGCQERQAITDRRQRPVVQGGAKLNSNQPDPDSPGQLPAFLETKVQSSQRDQKPTQEEGGGNQEQAPA